MHTPTANTRPAPATASAPAAINRAAKGDASALPVVRTLVRCPEFLADWGGDLGRVTANAVIDQVAGTNLLLREALRHKAELLRVALGGPAPSALEQVVADRVVMR